MKKQFSLSLLLLPLALSLQAEESHFSPCAASQYESTATMRAVVYQGDQILADCEVGAFTPDGECRGAAYSQSQFGNKVYLTLHGEETGPTLTFKVAYTDADGVTRIRTCNETWEFQPNAIPGIEGSPFELTLHLPTGDVNGDTRLSVSDLTSLISLACGVQPTSPCHPFDADFDGDDAVSNQDVQPMVNLLIKKQ